MGMLLRIYLLHLLSYLIFINCEIFEKGLKNDESSNNAGFNVNITTEIVSTSHENTSVTSNRTDLTSKLTTISGNVTDSNNKHITTNNLNSSDGLGAYHRTAKLGKFPYQASIGELSDDDVSVHYCGGVIIGELFVLTAAECRYGLDGHIIPLNRTTVSVGFIVLDENIGQSRKVVIFELYPKYNRSSADHDIAIIKVDRKWEYNDHVKPAKFVKKRSKMFIACHTTTWGITIRNKYWSTDLLIVNVSRIPDTNCRGYKIYRDDRMICVDVSLDKNLCDLDCGQPLVCNSILSGISRSPDLCGHGPDVYTDVSYYHDWIELYMYFNSSCVKFSNVFLFILLLFILLFCSN